jgi:Ca-activated chloride channel homolog
MSSATETPVDIKCIANRSNLKAGSSAVVFLAIDLSARPITSHKRKRTNVALAIDCSGSMTGEKMKRAIESAVGLSQELTSDDWISIVSFSTRAKVELPASNTPDSKTTEEAIRSLAAKGSTDLYGGLELAFDEARKNSHSPGVVTRILLLTDGKPTEGRTYEKDFVDLASRARSEYATIATVGIGDDYNEELLTKIAQAGGGVWYHTKDPKEDLKDIMVEQVTEITNTVVTHPELKLEIMDGAEIMEAYSVRPMLNQLTNLSAQGNTYTISLPDLVSGEQQNFVFRIKVPSEEAGQYRLVRSGIQNTFQDVNVSYTDEARMYNSEANPYPRILLSSAQGTVLMRKGIETASKKTIDQASTILKNVFDDPNMATAVRTNQLVEDVVTTLQAAQSTVVRGIETEAEKKEFMQDTTIIGRKRTEEK